MRIFENKPPPQSGPCLLLKKRGLFSGGYGTCIRNSNLFLMLLTTWSLSGCNSFSRKLLLERRERLFNCSCLRSKLSCMGCMRAQRKSTHEKLIPSSLRLMALITFLPTTSRKLHVCVSVCSCMKCSPLSSFQMNQDTMQGPNYIGKCIIMANLLLIKPNSKVPHHCIFF